jgi:molybdopterin/thiamine biosynthesis adenylyltransferase
MEKPIILDPTVQKLQNIKNTYFINQVLDTYREQLEDLFLIRNPKYKFNKNYQGEFEIFLKSHSLGKPLQDCGKWVYFPWNKTLVHYLDDATHQEIRTARNKNLILKEEQEKFYNFRIGIAGLSVGSHGAITTALMGGGKVVKLADPDIVSPSNLNRMRFDFIEVGKNKTELVAQYIYQLNPYAEVHIYQEGITEANLGEFLDGLDILIEELDDIEIKVKIREEAKKRKLPVVMATDNGDNIILDIERFDLNPDLEVFNGVLKDFDLKEIKRNPQKMYEAMAKIIDLSLVPPKVLNSVLEVGKTIYSWPQLATAATLSGVVIAYVVKRIALGENVREGKFEVNLDSILDPDYEKNKDSRARELEKFLEAVGFSKNHG